MRGAQPWVGRAKANFGSFYLWGDVPTPQLGLFGDEPRQPLLPTRRSVMKRGVAHRSNGETNFHGKKLANDKSWSDYGKADYVPFGFNRSAEAALKASGFRFDGSGRSFPSECVGRKVPGGGADGWFGENDNPLRQHTKGHPARKQASALIAKIPEPLARHVARVFRP